MSLRKCLVLFAVIFLWRLDSLALKSVFVIKFACTILALNKLVAKVLNFEVSVYLSWLWSVSLFSISVILVLKSVFLTKLLIPGILFSTVINTVFVAKLLVSGFFSLIQ